MARIAGLDVARIVAAAIALADRNGLDKLTMRRLSTELGVTPMATYHHVSSKDQLIDLVIDESIGQLGIADIKADPEPAIVDWFTQLHAQLVEHPSLAQAAAGRRIAGPHASRAAIALTVLAEGLCSDADSAAELIIAAFWLTLGSGLHRASRHPGGYAADGAPTGHEEAAATDVELALRARLLTTAAGDEQFRRSLTLLIRGHVSAETATIGLAQH